MVEIVSMIKKSSLLEPTNEPVKPSTESDTLFNEEDSLIMRCQLSNIRHVATRTFQMVDRVLCDDRSKPCPLFDRLDDLMHRFPRNLTFLMSKWVT